MVFVLHESKATKIYKNARHCVVFKLGNHKKYEEDDISISYADSGIIPDDDVIRSVIDGSVKAKSVIKSAIKQIYYPNKAEMVTFPLAFAEIINIITNVKDNKKNVPSVIVFAFDDPSEKEDEEAKSFRKSREKFLTRYITELFAAVDVQVISESDKKIDKFLKIFRGGKKKASNRLVKACKENKKLSATTKTIEQRNRLVSWFGIELVRASMSAMKVSDINEKDRVNFSKTLLRAFTNDNMKPVCVGLKKKEQIKLCKALRKKNKVAVEAYNSFAAAMKEAFDTKLPKVKLGYKNGKKIDAKPKMDTHKFMKFFIKKKNSDLLIAIYTHISLYTMGLTPDTKEYSKQMKATMGDLFEANVVSKFIETVATVAA